MYAAPKSAYPVITPEKLAEYDGFLLGVPTRYGNQSAQWRSFWDSTGSLWQTGALHGKYAGVFVSTGGSGGGQEATVIASLSTLAHHGVIVSTRSALATVANAMILSVCSSGLQEHVRAVDEPVGGARWKPVGLWRVLGGGWLAPAERARARDRPDPWQDVLRDAR